jgi:hypothetical protein
MGREADLGGDIQAVGLGVDAMELDRLLADHEVDAVEPGQEVEMPPGAAEFAIGRKLEADLLLLGDDLADLRTSSGT